MSIGLLGRKLGMTRVFNEEGNTLPVTVVEIEPNRITQIKTQQSDGYDALQITTGAKKPNRVSKPMAGHFAKAKLEAGRALCEFRFENPESKLSINDEATLEVGGEIPLHSFEVGQKVDVTGISRGFGFQGGIKRHNFRGQDNSHGNSISHRANGSIGQCQTPGRVFKGKKMSGHMGDSKVTTQNLEIVKIDVDKSLILIKGAVPGSKGGNVIIRHAIK